MVKELTNRIADTFRNEDCWTVEQLAKDMGIKTQRVRALAKEAIKRRKIQNLLKKDGVRVLYPEPFATQLIKLYNSGELGTVKRRKGNVVAPSDLKSAKYVVQVPIFDSDIGDALMAKFGSEAKIKEFLTDKLFEVGQEALAPLNEAKKQLEDAQRAYEEKKKHIFSQARVSH